MVAIARRHPILVPVIVLVLGLATTLAASYGLYRLSIANLSSQFESHVTRTEAAIVERVSTYVALLEGVTGLFAASGQVTQEDFRAYVGRLDLPRRYPGIQGVGWTVRLDPERIAEFEEARRASGAPDFRVWPETPRDEYHSIVYLEPSDLRNQAALGYDMYSEATRREAMATARDTGLATASGRVELVQEIDDDRQAGFLIYVPAYEGGDVPGTVAERRARLMGFAYSPFRADDLFAGILDPLADIPLEIDVFVGEPRQGNRLHSSWTQAGASAVDRTWTTDRDLDIAGRSWTVVYTAKPRFAAEADLGLLPLIPLAGVLATLLMAALTFAVARAWRTSADEASLRREAEGERALALRELNHRVKNTFATILAITRQTARATEEKEAFVEVLTARLTALSKTNALLIETNWAGTSLRRILQSELQPYGCMEQARCSMNGVDIELDSRVSLALAMVFHELATNAAKYGALSVPGGRMDISWSVAAGEDGDRLLDLEWIESGGPAVAPPTRRGFGSRLIEGSIVQQLEGEIDVDHAEDGLRCRFKAYVGKPAQDAAAAHADQDGPEVQWLADAEKRAPA